MTIFDFILYRISSILVRLDRSRLNFDFWEPLFLRRSNQIHSSMRSKFHGLYSMHCFLRWCEVIFLLIYIPEWLNMIPFGMLWWPMIFLMCFFAFFFWTRKQIFMNCSTVHRKAFEIKKAEAIKRIQILNKTSIIFAYFLL